MGGAELQDWTVQAAAQYERTHQQYVGGARKLESLINELIGEEEGINYLSATARAKDPGVVPGEGVQTASGRSRTSRSTTIR